MHLIDIEVLNNNYFVNSYDVPYELNKGGVIYIKPILVKDYPLYEYGKSVLEIKKNEINDINVIKMSYLDFLNYLIEKNEMIGIQLFYIFKFCLGFEKVAFGKDKNKTCILILGEDDIVEKVVTNKEFKEISEIILNQNDYNYDNRYVNPEVREMLAEYYAIKYKDINTPTLEKKKAFVASKIGKTFKEINEITYREFELIYKASIDSEIYIGEKIIQGSYKYKVDNDIIHPMFEKDKDPYAEIFEDTSVLSNKGITGAEQLNILNINK